MSSFTPRTIATTAALLLASAAIATAASITTTAGTEVAYADAAATPLVTYGEIAGEAGAGPSLTVYGDGTAIAEYPPGWKRAGRHRTRLSKSELDALVATLVDAGIVDFDMAAVQQAVRSAAANARAAGGGPDVFAVSDPDVTVISVTLDRYQRAGGPATTGVTKRIVWKSLALDVRTHPSITALTNLDAARQALRAVLVRVDYTKED